MALERLFDSKDGPVSPDDLYMNPGFPPPPEDRPHVFLGMVSSVDGKIRLGPPGTTAKGLGSQTDQLLMRRLQEAAQGIVVGAGTLRAGNMIYGRHIWRSVVTRRGDLPLANRFFADAPDRAIIFAPKSLPESKWEVLEAAAALRFAGEDVVDVSEAARIMKSEFGIRTLALEGGADLNWEFFKAGIVDELFLTVAPKIKGGSSFPTIVTGEGFPGIDFAPLELRSVYRDEDELYLRYHVGGR